MHLSTSLILTLSVVSIHARSWSVGLAGGIFGPLGDIVCTIKPELGITKDKAVAAVGEAVQSSKDLLHFDLTHNPIAFAYDFLDPVIREGDVSQGLQNVAAKGRDYQGLTIGFAKETVNQAEQLSRLEKFVDGEIWEDIAICLIQGGTQLAYSAGMAKPAQLTQSKIAAVPNKIKEADALRMTEGCLKKPVTDLAKPAIFNITRKSLFAIERSC